MRVAAPETDQDNGDNVALTSKKFRPESHTRANSDSRSATPQPYLPLHFPRMDPIWNTLPTGTFREFARYALHENLDSCVSLTPDVCRAS